MSGTKISSNPQQIHRNPEKLKATKFISSFLSVQIKIYRRYYKISSVLAVQIHPKNLPLELPGWRETLGSEDRVLRVGHRLAAGSTAGWGHPEDGKTLGKTVGTPMWFHGKIYGKFPSESPIGNANRNSFPIGKLWENPYKKWRFSNFGLL